MIVSTVYIGRDDLITLELTEGDGVISFDAVTAVEVKLGDTVINADNAPGCFDWLSEQGKLLINLGAFPGLVTGQFYAHLIVYSQDHPKGIVWGNEIWQINVIAV